MKRFIFSLHKRWFIIVGACVLVGVVAGLAWLILSGNVGAKDPAVRELNQAKREIGRLAILPTGEDPTVATVKDKTKLTDNFLKARAENGDKVLIYYVAQKVYLYRPSVKRIVDIGPLLIDAAIGEVKGTRIAIRNGSRINDNTQTIQEAVTVAYPETTLLTASPASRKDYPSTLVIDLTENKTKPNLVNGLARVVKGQRGRLPVGEPKPDADILILIGNDQ